MQATIETDMNSVERVLEYSKLAPEAPAILPAHRPPANWPNQGAIRAERLVVRYRADLDPVLKVRASETCVGPFATRTSVTKGARM
jgi:ATP-binding cassette subfamily C (CFTR/MRP) protein 1